jgi:hypothetical protein
MMGIIAMQILFIWFWLHTYGRALSSLRVLHVRTAGVFGWGWFSQWQQGTKGFSVRRRLNKLKGMT